MNALNLRLTLLLALLFAQGLAAMHSFEHPMPVPEHDCWVCPHVQALGTALTPSPPRPLSSLATERPFTAEKATAASRPSHFQPIRGPPPRAA